MVFKHCIYSAHVQKSLKRCKRPRSKFRSRLLEIRLSLLRIYVSCYPHLT